MGELIKGIRVGRKEAGEEEDMGDTRRKQCGKADTGVSEVPYSSPCRFPIVQLGLACSQHCATVS